MLSYSRSVIKAKLEPSNNKYSEVEQISTSKIFEFASYFEASDWSAAANFYDQLWTNDLASSKTKDFNDSADTASSEGFQEKEKAIGLITNSQVFGTVFNQSFNRNQKRSRKKSSLNEDGSTKKRKIETDDSTNISIAVTLKEELENKCLGKNLPTCVIRKYQKVCIELMETAKNQKKSSYILPVKNQKSLNYQFIFSGILMNNPEILSMLKNKNIKYPSVNSTFLNLLFQTPDAMAAFNCFLEIVFLEKNYTELSKFFKRSCCSSENHVNCKENWLNFKMKLKKHFLNGLDFGPCVLDAINQLSSLNNPEGINPDDFIAQIEQ